MLIEKNIKKTHSVKDCEALFDDFVPVALLHRQPSHHNAELVKVNLMVTTLVDLKTKKNNAKANGPRIGFMAIYFPRAYFEMSLGACRVQTTNFKKARLPTNLSRSLLCNIAMRHWPNGVNILFLIRKVRSDLAQLLRLSPSRLVDQPTLTSSIILSSSSLVCSSPKFLIAASSSSIAMAPLRSE